MEAGGQSPFRSRVIFVFITAFGGLGFIGTTFDWALWASALLGLAGGALVAGGTFAFLIVPLARQQGTS